MSWRREDHYARVMAAPAHVKFDVIDITPRHAPTPERVPLPEQDVRELARAGRHRAAVAFKREELVALAYAGEALEPLSRTWWARLMRRLRGLVSVLSRLGAVSMTHTTRTSKRSER